MMPLMGSLERILLGNPLGGSYTGSVKSMWEQGSINIDTGEETSSETGVRSGYLDARENAYYTQRTIGWGTFDRISWYFYTSEKEFLGAKTDTTWTALELALVNCEYIRLVISNEATPISPTDVPDITLEDRSVWGWKDPNHRGSIISTKLVDIKKDHYYYQKSNIVEGFLFFDAPSFAIRNSAMAKAPESHESTYMYLTTENGATPNNIGDLVFEDRDVWGWHDSANLYIVSQLLPIEKRIVSARYAGDLKASTMGIYNQDETKSRSLQLPVQNKLIDDQYVVFRLFVLTEDNPGITPADMVNHGTWTVTFSDPVSDHWQDNGTDIWQQIDLKTAGKSLAITAPESFVGCYITYQMSDGQHHATLPYTLPDTTDVEWVQLRIPNASNPSIDLINVDSYDDQWSWVFGEIVVTEPHWEGENFIFSASDIQVGKAWQKSGDNIILMDDASSIALPIIPNVSASWTILIDNSSDITLTGVEIRKTSSGVTVGDGAINANAGRSVILQDATGEVAFHFTKGSLTADTLYSAIKIHGR